MTVEGRGSVAVDARHGRPTGKRERTKAANRDEIRGAAVEAFTELGFGATTVRDIVRRTALASGTFYNYYADKHAILTELVGEHVAEAGARMAAARTAATTPREAIERGAAAYFRLLMESPELLAMYRRNAGTIRAYASGNLGRFGALVDESQQAAEEKLGNQVPETIALWRLARERGAIAASAFGAGFGGSVWALVNWAEAEEFADGWREAYRAGPGRERRGARWFITRPGVAATLAND